MYPHFLHILGSEISVWNSVFFIAVVVGFFVFRVSAKADRRLSRWAIRYVIVVYLSALAAQVFAYAFDAHTSLFPPPGTSSANWYLNPIAGTKTLYGVIVLMPVSVALATLGTRISLMRALDVWTPAMFVVLSIARLGCFLQGCCYGMRSDLFGIAFPVGSLVYHQQLGAGLIAEGSTPLPTIPTQGIESVFLAMVAVWSFSRVDRRSVSGVFVPAVAMYSVFRFGIEFVRADVDRAFYGPLTTSQWIAMIVLSVAATATVRARPLSTGAESTVAAPVAPSVDPPRR